jgi:hypothetical protein
MKKRERLLAYLRDVCLGDKFPVWATLVGVIIGALATVFGTYWLVPRINEALERQKIRTEFVIRNLDDLNARTRELISEISEFHYLVLQSDKPDQASIQKISSTIAQMQWKAVELGIIFEGTPGLKAVRAYQAALDRVRDTVSSVHGKGDLSQTEAAAEAFSRQTLEVLRQLAALAGLKITDTPNFLKP